MGSSKITVQIIVNLFNVIIKVKYKEILYWYYYYKAYKNQIRDVKSINKIDDQLAKILIYCIMKLNLFFLILLI